MCFKKKKGNEINSAGNLNLFPEFFSEETQKKIKEAFEITDEFAYILSKYGWYISANMSWVFVFEVFRAAKNNDNSFINNNMTCYYRDNLGIIQKQIIEKFPERMQIISEAFEAHRREMYFSSTALFLTQTDGLCKGRLFRHKKARQLLMNEKKRRSIFEAVLYNESAINVDTRKTDKSEFKSDLNRHAVLHGLDTSYSNEINSLKALSILCFVADYLES